MTKVFEWAKYNAITTESSYPYVAKYNSCRSVSGQVKVASFAKITSKNPVALMTAVTKGPVAISLWASSQVFRYYKSGILSSPDCDAGYLVNHGVGLVGYGSENGTNYWIVRNTWGTSWGESGYVRILRTSANNAGICGMLMLSSLPTV